ncbi:MAG: YeeE/YedE family protein [Proteobacteria bacterium]|nr:YeeE/YedE family protein [Pseudomonadota bacterium]
MDGLSVGMLAALVGLCGGVVMGMSVRLGDFCTLGAIESAVYGDDQTRLRMWGLALGVAILGTFLLAEFTGLSLAQSFYHSIAWNPIASIVGGLMFGYGMAYAGNCGFSALARIGGGDLRALIVVLVMAIFAGVTLGGPLAYLRERLFPQGPSDGDQGFGSLFLSLTGLSPLILAGVVALGFFIWGISYRNLRESKASVFWAVMVGLAIVSGWWGTNFLAQDSLGGVDVQSHSFTAPLARTVSYAMISTAGGLNFSIGSVVGVILGGFLGLLIKGHFRWEACEDPQELGRQMMGAAFMGVGGVIALGCSIGQGLTAFSTLAYSAPVTVAAIIVGAIFGLRRLVSGFQPN